MSFGRKGLDGGGDLLAARRTAFLAEERSRAQRPAPAAGPAEPVEPVYVRQKTAGTAYLLWFLLGGLSIHRFYLGYRVSGLIQAVLTPIGYSLLISGTDAGYAFLGASGLWILADALLIPDMVKAANARFRRDALATAAVFA